MMIINIISNNNLKNIKLLLQQTYIIIFYIKYILIYYI
jgi:hypothetical protein